MTIIVEDATGLSNSESYISVEFYRSYWLDRGVTIAGTDEEIEPKLRIATEFIDIRWGASIPGDPISEDQALRFPTDCSITDPVSLPTQLEKACAEYTYWSETNGSLFLDNDGSNGPGITFLREKIGPIETETEWSGSGDGSSTRKYPAIIKADALMKQILSSTASSTGGVYR